MAKLVIVSNRLPVSVKKVDGKLEFSDSIGGLATGLASIGSGISMWIGWPGILDEELTDDDRASIRKYLKKKNCYPIFLSKKLVDDYYNEYSNRILWPLFHHLPVGIKTNKTIWNAYQKANKIFADEVLKLTKPGSTIWIHDYQLLLVPGLLRVARPHDKIGFFLHIPFPKPTVWEKLPESPSLTLGLLGADLLGFHTTGYMQNFLDYAKKIHAGTVLDRKIALTNRVVRVADFPLGIDYEKFAQATKKRVVQVESARLKWKYRGKKVIVAFDRLDPTKGFLERLRAYRTLLREHPELKNKVVLVMVANPTRSDVPEYIKLKNDVEKLVADINTQFGTLRWQPIDYSYEIMGYEQIAALFDRSDVGFLVPIRDGMNLVTKEYIASQQNLPGVLVLSETAGSAEELKEAILVNPKKHRTIVDGLYLGLTMKPAELKRRTKTMQRHLAEFTAESWAKNFVGSLQRPRNAPSLKQTRTLNATLKKQFSSEYKKAKKRLLLLDYDGTLTPFAKHPGEAKPSKELLTFLKRLSKDPLNDVVIVSGRDKDYLQTWFGGLNMGLAAEHGALFRRKGGKNWHKTSSAPLDWQPDVLELFNYYSYLTPGAFTEKKNWALVWHYRNASPFYAQKHLVALRRLTKPIVKEHALTFKEGNKVVEILPTEINKGRIAQEWLIHDHDFVLCIGDDTTDEDMFRALPANAWSIKVGRGRTAAKYRLPDVPAVHELLKLL